MLSLLAAAALAAELEAANVSIEIDGDVTRVEASFRVRSGEPVRWRAPRFPGQELTLLDGPAEIQGDGGAAHFETHPGAAGPDEIVLRYELTGDNERVPLFVPAAPARAGAIEIRLRGFEGERALRAGFPRFEAVDDGTLVARPANLPSFVRLPPPAGALSVHRLAEILVLVLVLGGTLAWIVLRRRSAVRTAPG